MLFNVTDSTFSKEVLESNIPVLVDFWAPWCGLCRLIEPTLISFQAKYQGEFKLIRVNADDNFRLANTYRLRILPTLIFFNGESIIYRLEGFQSKAELSHSLETMISNLFAISA